MQISEYPGDKAKNEVYMLNSKEVYEKAKRGQKRWEI
jgi:hypothetical protein